jgi:predicted nuclease of restriction endonuclease-like (RecB) superfamily
VGRIVSGKVADGAWGKGTVDALAAYIADKNIGLSGFTRRGLYRMKQFYEEYSNPFYSAALRKEHIVTPLASLLKMALLPKVTAAPTLLQNYDNEVNTFVTAVLTQITWSNHLEILSRCKEKEEKLFYLLMDIQERWNLREIRRQIKSGTYERMILSDNLKINIKAALPTNLFKDPYIFEFLDLPGDHTESDLEKALVNNLQKFILEIGKGFAYMGRQYRLQVGNKDYFTDLLFYQRDLQCLVLFELKMEEFTPEALGKLNFYLEALDRDVRRPHEHPSIGVLLCKGKDTEVVEYATARNLSPTIIADYETKLIDKKLLAEKLHQFAEQWTAREEMLKENSDAA